jgi:prephenate dehydratase
LSFDELVDSLLSEKTDQQLWQLKILLRVIIPNYALIDRIIYILEHYVRIHQNLMALPGQELVDILEVHSHPMALLQCMEFFKSTLY